MRAIVPKNRNQTNLMKVTLRQVKKITPLIWRITAGKEVRKNDLRLVLGKAGLKLSRISNVRRPYVKIKSKYRRVVKNYATGIKIFEVKVLSEPQTYVGPAVHDQVPVDIFLDGVKEV